MECFDRLSPALRYQIVNELGWRELRPVQMRAIAPILDGCNCVILAPTAGGKTEAALFPLLSLMDTEDRAATSLLYVAPIRALLNNIEPRLERLAALVGRRAFKWHGDVSAGSRRRHVKDLADVLAITPESLEAMLIGSASPRHRILGKVQAVVVDEVHSFAAGDRGGHLVALLERISRICGRDLQRIGLSATVGNPEAICEWLSGSSRRQRAVVDPGGQRVQAQVALDYVGSMENAATVIEALHRGRKRLVFADSRRRVEELGGLLTGRGVDAYVTHSSLAVSERQAAERAFAEKESCVVVATSALELGIDIGDLDHVLQIDAPATVASFLQRMGRTGRRPGSVANCTFLATKGEALLQAAGLVRLHGRGFVEPVTPVRRGAHLLAHQLLALSLQQHGVPRSEWWAWVQGAACFADLDDTDRGELLDHMLQEEILVQADARLVLGDSGERLYGRRHFMELFAVFSTPPVLTVTWGTQEVGTIDSYFALYKEPEDLVFVLGGRAWRVTHLDWSRATCYVEPAPEGRLPVWLGDPVLLSRELCQAMREVLVEDGADASWSRRAVETIRSLREEHHFLRDEVSPVVDEGDRVRWWTFAGGKANNVLAALLGKQLGGTVTGGNLAVSFNGVAARSDVAIRQSIAALRSPDAFDRHVVLGLAAGCARHRLSKFQPCLSERLELAFLAESLMDIDGARAAVG